MKILNCQKLNKQLQIGAQFIRHLYFLFVAAMVLTANGMSPLFAGVGTSGAQFLKLGIGARAAAMGESFVAVADDASAIYWNPAGLTRLTQRELSASHHAYIQGLNYETIAYSQPTRFGTMGSAVNYLYLSGLERRTKDEKQEGTFGASDAAFTLSFARPLFANADKNIPVAKQFSIGFNLKVIRQEIESHSANAFAMDIGLLTPLRGSQLTLGFTVQNLGTPVRFMNESYPLPLTFRTGLAWNAKHLPMTLTGSISVPRDHSPTYEMGMEYWVISPFALRGGYLVRPAGDSSLFQGVGSNSNSNLSRFGGLMAGFGLKFRHLGIDYAFVPLGDLGNTHRVTFGMRFK